MKLLLIYELLQVVFYAQGVCTALSKQDARITPLPKGYKKCLKIQGGIE